jgi:hypothetical protein
VAGDDIRVTKMSPATALRPCTPQER